MKRIILINRHFIITLLLAVLWSFTSVAQKGVVATSEKKSFKDDKVSKSKMYFTANKMMMKDGSNTVIFDAEKETFTNIDHQKKEYMVITKEDLEKTLGQLDKATMMMEEKMKNLSPAQQEMMRKNMPGFVSQPKEEPKVEFVKVKSGITVKNWTVDKYEHLVDGEKVNNYFIANYAQLDVTKNDFVVMEKMAKFFQKYMSNFSSMNAQSSFQSSTLGLGEDSPVFNKGIPIKTVSFKNGERQEQNLIQTLEKKNIDPSKFEPPSNYKMTSLTEQIQGSKFGIGKQ